MCIYLYVYIYIYMYATPLKTHRRPLLQPHLVLQLHRGNGFHSGEMLVAALQYGPRLWELPQTRNVRASTAVYSSDLFNRLAARGSQA